MNKIECCPQCGARCKTTANRETGEVRYEGLQDEDLLKKIEQLKQQLLKKDPTLAKRE